MRDAATGAHVPLNLRRVHGAADSTEGTSTPSLTGERLDTESVFRNWPSWQFDSVRMMTIAYRPSRLRPKRRGRRSTTSRRCRRRCRLDRGRTGLCSGAAGNDHPVYEVQDSEPQGEFDERSDRERVARET